MQPSLLPVELSIGTRRQDLRRNRRLSQSRHRDLQQDRESNEEQKEETEFIILFEETKAMTIRPAGYGAPEACQRFYFIDSADYQD